MSWTVAHQTPLSMGFPRQEHWNGLPFLPPGNIPDLEASDPITSWEIDGETVETVSDFILRGSKITADGDCSLKLKDICSLEEKL